MQLIAKTLQGLEPVLAGEIEQLKGRNIRILNRAVLFEGDKELMYKANYYLRTALRILKPVGSFTAEDSDRLYQQSKIIPWEKFLHPTDTFYIDSVVQSEYFKHSKFVSQRVKDAIADRFMEKYGKRPDVSRINPVVRINVHISRNLFNLSLDSSGDSLHRRGYRKMESLAPLNEVLAAGMVLLSGWDGKQPLHDPMCGSGSVVIEAALFALNIPPGSFRKDFGFQKWNDYDQALFDRIVREGRNKTMKELRITGSDISEEAVSAALQNLKNAGLEKIVNISVRDFFMHDPVGEPAHDQVGKPGIIIINPPYGERINEPDLEQFYKKTGDKLKNNYTGNIAWVLSANEEAMKHFGLHSFRKIELYNGPLKCHFYGYNLYAGSIKTKYRQE